MKEFIKDKRNELIRAIGQQEYSLNDIADMFGTTKSAVYTIIRNTPEGWTSPWVKKK